MQGKTKGLLGCGGCGCLSAIGLLVASFFLPAILYSFLPGSIAGFTGLGMQGLGGLLCLLSGVLLIVGIIFMMKDKKAGDEDEDE